jgi:enediyne biosynthesis protein E4
MGPDGRTRRRSPFLIGLVVGTSVMLTAVLGFGVGPVRSGAAATTDTTVPRFVEEAAAAGLQHVYDGDFRFFVGGGVAAFDCDDDGLPELYLAGGEQPAALYRNHGTPGGSLAMTADRDRQTDLRGVTGAYPLDIDGDGHLDLAVLRQGENVLLRGLGDCRFERANEAWGFDGGDEWTVAFSATWEPGATLPTLAIGNYLDPDDRDRATCTDNLLVRPDPDTGRFAAPVPLAPSWCTLSLLFSDWDRSGRPDLRVSNDRHYARDGREQLWSIIPGQAPREYTEQDGWQPLQVWGMGIASQDLTGDGRPEVFLTSQGDNKLQTLVAGALGPHYTDIAIQRRVTAHRPHTGDDIRPSTAWHAEFQDVNNDGRPDLFVAKGNVEAMPDHAERDPDNLLLGEPDGTFSERATSAGLLRFDRARGAALVDLNLDGLLDLVVVNRRTPTTLWRNLGTGTPAAPTPLGNAVAVRPRQDGPNRDAIGAWIELATDDGPVWRELTVGGGHASGQAGWIHLGLGTAEGGLLRVHWPDGAVGPWLEVPAGGHAIVERGRSRAVLWSPAVDPDVVPS